MKIFHYKLIIFLFFFLSGTASLYAQASEGVLITEIRDSSGKNNPLVMYWKGSNVKVAGSMNGTELDFYITADSIAMVRSGQDQGLIFGLDSGIKYFRPLKSDSVISRIATLETKLIFGFHCTCITMLYKSGKKKELWITSEVGEDICTMFANSRIANDLFASHEEAVFVSGLNQMGKFIIAFTSYKADGTYSFDGNVKKVGKRPVSIDEVELPAGIKLRRVTPEMLRNNKTK
jgi:hypothetical protein